MKLAIEIELMSINLHEKSKKKQSTTENPPRNFQHLSQSDWNFYGTNKKKTVNPHVVPAYLSLK